MKMGGTMVVTEEGLQRASYTTRDRDLAQIFFDKVAAVYKSLKTGERAISRGVFAIRNIGDYEIILHTGDATVELNNPSEAMGQKDLIVATAIDSEDGRKLPNAKSRLEDFTGIKLEKI